MFGTSIHFFYTCKWIECVRTYCLLWCFCTMKVPVTIILPYFHSVLIMFAPVFQMWHHHHLEWVAFSWVEEWVLSFEYHCVCVCVMMCACAWHRSLAITSIAWYYITHIPQVLYLLPNKEVIQNNKKVKRSLASMYSYTTFLDKCPWKVYRIRKYF